MDELTVPRLDAIIVLLSVITGVLVGDAIANATEGTLLLMGLVAAFALVVTYLAMVSDFL